MYIYIYICIYICIQLPCGPIPATVSGMGPKATKTNQNRHHELSKKHQKLMPGGVPEALGGGLGTILAARGAPEVSQGRPETKKSRKRTSQPPPGTQLGGQILTFRRFCWSFSYCFFECRFERPPGPILNGLAEVLQRFLNMFFIIF